MELTGNSTATGNEFYDINTQENLRIITFMSTIQHSIVTEYICLKQFK